MSDTDFPFDPDDPRVTAYALDEMQDAGARAGFEQILAHSPEARALVEEIRALSTRLVAEYDEERRVAQTQPANVIPMAIAAPRRHAAWAGQLLRMAAALAVLGIAAVLLSPYVRSPQAVQLHPEADRSMASEHEARPAPAALKKSAEVPRAADGLREPAAAARAGVASQIAIQGDLNAPASSLALNVNGKADGNGKADQAAPARALQQESAKALDTVKLAPVARPIAATDAKDENALLKAPRSGEDAVDQLKPVLEKRAPALAAAMPALSPAAPAVVAGNAMGGGGAGGGGGAPVDSSIVAKDALLQNRYANGAGNSGSSSASGAIFSQSNVGSLQRLAPASQTRVAGRRASPDASGFVALADAPVPSFDIAVNSNWQAKLATASEARQMARAPAAPAPAAETLRDFPLSQAPPPPADPRALAIQTESASCPWAPGHRLVRISFKGRDPAATLERDASDAQAAAATNDVRQVQVKFDPAQVAAYRLVGAGRQAIQLNAWQEATLLYEVTPAPAEQVVDKTKELDRLPVDRPAAQTATDSQAARLRLLRPPALLTVTVLAPAVKAGVLSDAPSEEFTPSEVRTAPDDISSASADFKFAAAVAAYNLAVKAPPDKGTPTLDLAIRLAQEGLGNDPGGYRAAFLQKLRKAQAGH